ncbi:unnamed protein product, partial [marine sediment metagenome]
YARALPSDTQQFLSIDEAASYQLEGKESARIWPQQSSRWFAEVSRDVLDLVEQAQERIGRKKNKEFDSTLVDLKILANLALYHSHRANAGVSWALFKHRNDINALDDAIGQETRAIAAWEKLVEAAGDVYNDNLMMGREGAGLSGHWRDELVKLRKGLEKLQLQRKSFRPTVTGDKPLISHVPIRKTVPTVGLAVRATVSSKEPIANVKVAYGYGQGKYKYAEMKQIKPYIYRTLIPGSQIKEGLDYFIEAVDETGNR